MAEMYRVELVNRDGFTLEVAADQTILEAAEAAGWRLPVGCRYGVCITCAARLLTGEVEQPKAMALKPAQVEMGFVLLCVAYPRSHCRVEVGVESQAALYVNPFQVAPP